MALYFLTIWGPLVAQSIFLITPVIVSLVNNRFANNTGWNPVSGLGAAGIMGRQTS